MVEWNVEMVIPLVVEWVVVMAGMVEQVEWNGR